MIFTFSRREIYQRLLVMLLTSFLLMGLVSGNRAIRPSNADLGSNPPGSRADLPLTRAERATDRVALTFDVTWQQGELAKIVAILDSHDIKSTFFIGGTFLSLYGEQARSLQAHGHEVGTLGQRVVDLSGLTEREVVSNLQASQSALAKLLGGPARYFRPPMGPATPAVVRSARTAGLVTVTYSLDSEDNTGIKADEIVSNVVRRSKPGDIIRLTASDWNKETAKALPGIIQGLQERNLKMVRLSDLAEAP